MLTQMTETFGGDDQEGQGDEGEEATQATQANQPQRKRARITPQPTATLTSGATLSAAEHIDQAEEEGPPPPAKKRSISDSLSAAQEQRLVKFYATHPLFYDQTLSEFKDKPKKAHLQNIIGKEIGLTSKC